MHVFASVCMHKFTQGLSVCGSGYFWQWRFSDCRKRTPNNFCHTHCLRCTLVQRSSIDFIRARCCVDSEAQFLLPFFVENIWLGMTYCVSSHAHIDLFDIPLSLVFGCEQFKIRLCTHPRCYASKHILGSFAQTTGFFSLFSYDVVVRLRKAGGANNQSDATRAQNNYFAPSKHPHKTQTGKIKTRIVSGAS